MAMQDPIADFLTRIRNALAAGKEEVLIPSSLHKIEIVKVLKSEGYVHDFTVEQDGKKSFLKIALKYFEEKPAIARLRRISKPGCRVYSHAKAMPKVEGGLGVLVVSTPRGVMTGRRAYKSNVGGEVICEIF